jgi:hypothetical protein
MAMRFRVLPVTLVESKRNASESMRIYLARVWAEWLQSLRSIGAGLRIALTGFGHGDLASLVGGPSHSVQSRVETQPALRLHPGRHRPGYLWA